MTFLTSSECERWCAERGLQTPQQLRGRPVPRGYVSHDFSIPEDAGARVSLCRLSWSHSSEWTQGQRLLWVSDWSVWPSGEHMPLFTMWRAAFGEHRGLMEAPGLVVEPNQDADGLSFLVLAALFLWDCCSYVEHGTVVMIDHDEGGSVLERRESKQSIWREQLRKFGVLGPS